VDFDPENIRPDGHAQFSERLKESICNLDEPVRREDLRQALGVMTHGTREGQAMERGHAEVLNARVAWT
jgi:hypothetical protein